MRTLSDESVDPSALRGTSDLGGLGVSAIDELLRTSVVLADLLDANADPILLRCIAMATPVLAPRIPGVIEQLGADYPLLYDSLAQADALASDRQAITAAHEQLVNLRSSRRIEDFLAAVDCALAEAGCE